MFATGSSIVVMNSMRLVVTLLAGLQVHAAAGQRLREPLPTRCGDGPGGMLAILNPPAASIGACPLEHTHVLAEISGLVGRVHVRQTFRNPFERKIEAVYVFPLPQDSAVDEMVMTVGDRRVVGRVHERDEARAIYQQARAAGYVAGLLDQERPNIFTQSVANIEPGAVVTIEISYVETLKYEEGEFEWVFPMVVGPRYIPGRPTSATPTVPAELKGQVVEVRRPVGAETGARARADQGGASREPATTSRECGLSLNPPSAPPQGSGWSPDTDRVPDASRITPPVVKPGLRAGHDISLTVSLAGGAAGLAPQDIRSLQHQIDVAPTAARERTLVTLRNQAEVPNRDFVLRYRLGGDEIGDAFLVGSDARGTYFTLVLQPPPRVAPGAIVPRELIFVLDTSGSMHGVPIEKAKQLMGKAIDAMQALDTFNVITFSGDTRILWDRPRANAPGNRAAAQAFLAEHSGTGGTEMMKAIEAALRPTQDRAETAGAEPAPIRVVMFLTDGYVGNDLEIIDAVKRYAGTTRVFSFGIGSSVNRFLLDGMASAGRGEVEYVLPGEDAGASSTADRAVERFHERVLAPLLTDIEIDWGTLPVADVHPRRIPDLFSAKPILVHGRLTGAAEGTIRIRGNTAAGPLELVRELRAGESAPAAIGDEGAAPPAVASLWARAAVAHLMNQDLAAMQRGEFPSDLKRQIVELGLGYRLMTQFTSFVAVEEMRVTVGGEPTTIQVPVEMPRGVSYEGVFGVQGRLGQAGSGRSLFLLNASPATATPSDATIRAGVALQSGGRKDAVQRGLAPRERGQGEAIATEAEEPVEAKLAGVLRGLAERAAREGADGSLTIGKLRVVDYRVDVIVTLAEASDDALARLRELGFLQSGESKASAGLVIGSIDVRKLVALAALPGVLSVRPVVE
jgi:Ca-activated chloride channel family protein